MISEVTSLLANTATTELEISVVSNCPEGLCHVYINVRLKLSVPEPVDCQAETVCPTQQCFGLGVFTRGTVQAVLLLWDSFMCVSVERRCGRRL